MGGIDGEEIFSLARRRDRIISASAGEAGLQSGYIPESIHKCGKIYYES